MAAAASSLPDQLKDRLAASSPSANRRQRPSVARSLAAVPLAARRVQPSGATIVRSPSVATMAMSRSPACPAGTVTAMVCGLPLPILSAVSPPTQTGASPVAEAKGGADGARVTMAKIRNASVSGDVAMATRRTARSARIAGRAGTPGRSRTCAHGLGNHCSVH